MAKRLVIGICGGTGSGKTTIAERIISVLAPASVLVLQQDHYYKYFPHLSLEERKQQNFDHPDSFDTALLVDHVRSLSQGHAIDRPIYDFALYQRAAETVRIESYPAIILEGILLFENKALRELMDIKIFVDTDADLRFIRRLRRDIVERAGLWSPLSSNTLRQCDPCTWSLWNHPSVTPM